MELEARNFDRIKDACGFIDPSRSEELFAVLGYPSLFRFSTGRPRPASGCVSNGPKNTPWRRLVPVKGSQWRVGGTLMGAASSTAQTRKKKKVRCKKSGVHNPTYF